MPTTGLFINLVEYQLPFARRTLLAPITLFGQTLNGLIDSGAMGYFTDRSLVKRLGTPTRKLLKPIAVYNMDNTENIAGCIEAEA